MNLPFQKTIFPVLNYDIYYLTSYFLGFFFSYKAQEGSAFLDLPAYNTGKITKTKYVKQFNKIYPNCGVLNKRLQCGHILELITRLTDSLLLDWHLQWHAWSQILFSNLFHSWFGWTEVLHAFLSKTRLVRKKIPNSLKIVYNLPLINFCGMLELSH